MNRILVLSPHPDDEAIGCGGTLCKHVHEGGRVRVVFLTSGENGGHGLNPVKTRAVRESEAHQAARILGLEKIEFWGAVDGELRADRLLVQRLRRALDSFKPALIYVPHDREMHPDHRAAVRLLRGALRAEPALSPMPVIRMFEVWTPLERLDEIVDISTFVKTKLAAIRAYKSQCRVLAFDEAILGLNRYRGEMHCWPEGEYAEVFRVLKV